MLYNVVLDSAVQMERNIDADIENKLVDTARDGEGGTVPVLLLVSFPVLTHASWFSSSDWALTQRAFAGTWFVPGAREGPPAPSGR